MRGRGTLALGIPAALLLAVAAWWLIPRGDDARRGAATPEPRGAAGADGPAPAALQSQAEGGVDDSAPRERAVAVGMGPDGHRPSPASRDAAPGEQPVAGIVLDARTGEPVPEFDLLLAAAEIGRRAPLRTDAEGRFRTATPFPLGSRLLAFSEGRARNDRPLFLGEEVTLRVDVGPTYRFDLSVPEGFDPLELRAVLTPADAPGLQLAAANLRTGAPPWVRFAWTEAFAERGGAAHRLELHTPNGLFAGAAEVILRPGIHPGLVQLRVEAFAVLAGTIEWHTGNFYPEDVEVRLDGGPGGATPLVTWARRSGRYSFERVPPGTWTLVARAPLHAPHEELVVLEGGRNHHLDIRLARLPGAGAVRGTLSSATGRHHPDAVVFLDALQPPHGSLEAEVEWTQDGEAWIGSFAFENLPPGRYAPQLLTDDWFDWQGSIEPVSPPRDDLWFACDDDVACADLLLRAVDARSGSAAGAFEGWWTANMDEDAFGGATGEAVKLVSGWPYGRALRWYAWAEGYGVARGDEASFGAPDRGGARSAEARLPPGWGAVLVTWGGDDHPLAGVRVALDGRPAGATDASGVLVLNAAGPPQTVACEHDSEIWIGGDLAPDARAFPRDARRLELLFEPRR